MTEETASITFRVPKSTKEKLEKLAEDRGASLSALFGIIARNKIRDGFKLDEEDNNNQDLVQKIDQLSQNVYQLDHDVEYLAQSLNKIVDQRIKKYFVDKDKRKSKAE